MWSAAEWSWCVHLWELQYRVWYLEVKYLQTLSCLTLTTHCCVMTTAYCDVILDVCRKWAMLPTRPPRFWRIFWLTIEIPVLRHAGFWMPRAFPHQLLGCGRVTGGGGGGGGMVWVCGKVSHYQGMFDRWDNVWAPLPKPMRFMGLKKSGVRQKGEGHRDCFFFFFFFIQVVAWCHYLSQCRPRSMLPYCITRP